MGVEESSIPIGSTKLVINPSVPITGQITIAVHGKRKVGKTSLIQKMKNCDLNPQYIPTKTMEATEFYWNPIRHPDETIKITVWDVVDQALKIPSETSNLNVVLPDANTVDTFTTTDGIIILYDPDDEATADYAAKIISSSPQKLPILCLANFLDRRKMIKKVPENLLPFMDRIIHVQTSIFSNRGLPVVAEWLDKPLLYSQEKYYIQLVANAEKEMNDFDKLFNEKIERTSLGLFQNGIEDDNEDFDEKSDELPEELINNDILSYKKTKPGIKNSNGSFSYKDDREVESFMVKLNYEMK
ncbi:hypothetical protein TRFO_29040 [Tritrichomonas foetus]|uniref:Uncharacterized protein n=1 Tax=Tritrichomonas foetus TaxID=1144522 RepID=A0A1J4K241_9EUKA|nr:hypothetical protein TRFO_29040 [Tritrichomonas foetus]|eukprot:OHT03549.1 hypothetical protein TRFO_29040 [Tritrichomonas foetus]